MDEFIKNGMKSILQDTRYSLYVVRDDSDILVGMFVFSEGIVLRKKNEYLDIIDDGCEYAILEGEHIIDKIRYSSLEIDYLAIQKEHRNQGIGSTIISELAKLAKSQGRHFLTVDAFHDKDYSAIPFYEKNQFLAVEDFREEQDTLRMFRHIE